MQYVVILLLISFAIVCPSSKWSAFLLIGFGALLCAFCTESFDLNNYKIMFEQSELYSEKMAFGWDILFKAAIKSGMSFTLFKGLCGLFTLFVVYCAAKRLTKNFSLVLALYSACLLLSQLTQIRNFMAMAVMLYGTTYLIRDDKHSMLKFLIFLFLSISLHYSMVFYVTFILVKPKLTSRQFNLATASLFVIEILVLYTNAAYNALIGFPAMYRVTRYLDFRSAIASLDSHSIKTVFLAMFVHLFIFFVCRMIYIYSKRDMTTMRKKLSPDYGAGVLSFDQIKLIYRIQQMLLLLLPLYVGSFSYLRLFENSIPLVFILIGNAVSVSRKPIQGYCKKYAKQIVFSGLLCGVVVFTVLGISYGEWLMTLNSFHLLTGN